MFFNLNRRSTFRRNLLLNLLSALLVATLVLTLFLTMYSRFRKQEMSQREHLLNTELEHIVGELDDLSGLFGQSKYMDSLNRIAILRAPLAARDYYALSTAQNYLSAIVAMNNSLSDAVLVFPQSDVLLTRGSIYVSESHFITQCKGTIDPSLFMREANKNGLSRAFYPGGTLYIGGSAHDVALICRLPLGTPSILETKCHAYLLLSYDELMDSLLTENMQRYGSMEIINEETGEVLCTYSASAELSREGVLVSVTNSTHTLRANAYLPESYFRNAMHGVSMLTSFGILSIFLISILGAYFTAWRQSLPMRRLLSDLAHEDNAAKQSENEYIWLKENIRRMNTERADIAQQLEQHRQAVRSSVLEALFSGSIMNPKRMAQAEACLAELPRPFFVGIARFRNDSLLPSESAQDVRLMIMLDDLKQLMDENSVLSTFDDRSIALLAPCLNGLDDALNTLENRLSRSEQFRAHPIQITVSGPVFELAEIATAFDAVLASGTKADDHSIHRADEYTEGCDFSFRNLQQFYALLAVCNGEGAKAVLNAYLISPYRHLGTLHQRFYTARAISMLAINALGAEDFPLRRLHFDVLDDSSILQEKFDSALDECLKQVVEQRSQAQDLRAGQVLSYISQHFCEPDCCPATIAEAFSLSEKHLYTLLRKSTNQTPAALLLDMRLNYAAKLLRETERPIQTLSEEAEFLNFSTFYKAFKRAYALTPSQYRASETAGNP